MLELLVGDAVTMLRTLEAESIHCCVTSPPYWGLRDYGVSGQLGLERTPEEYVSRLVEVFREVRRVLRGDGTLWLNLGDSYIATHQGAQGKRGPTMNDQGEAYRENVAVRRKKAMPTSLKSKDLVGIPWRVAFALQADGWYLRSDIIWAKPNPMPESVTDRPTKAHEYLFLLSKSARYYYDAGATKEPHGYNRWSTNRVQDASVLDACYAGQAGESSILRKGKINPFPDGGRNRRTVWVIATEPYPGAHFATFPEDLVKPCILAGCPVGGVVLDPFAGSGTTGKVALDLGRRAVLIELSEAYAALARKRTQTTIGMQFHFDPLRGG